MKTKIKNCQKKYKLVQNEVGKITKKDFDGQRIYGGKYLKNNGKTKTDFHGKKQPKNDSIIGRKRTQFCEQNEKRIINFANIFIWKSVNFKERKQRKTRTRSKEKQ